MRKGPTTAYIKYGIWHLGGRRKKQKGVFFPILRAITKPLLLSATTGIGGIVFFAKYQRVERPVLNATLVRTNRTYVQKIGLQRQRIRRYGPRNKRRRRKIGKKLLGGKRRVSRRRRAKNYHYT